jgi:antitoxin (DNA-binding transcriptional repressor) of toxin-antitoxin stability system
MSHSNRHLLARVKSGEEIAVTERGELSARITPASPGPLDPLISAGRVRPATVRAPPFP